MYNKMFSMHGITMVFFFLIPSVPAVLGNFLVPLMIGAKDLAFPRINLLSWYIYIAAGCLWIYTILTGGIDTGWTFYTPLSTSFSNTHVITGALSVFIAGFSSIFTGLNFIVTIHRMRAPGMTWNTAAAVSLVELRRRRHHGAGHAGAGHHPAAGGAGARIQHRRLQPATGRRPASVPAPLLVLLASGGLHHDSARHGRRSAKSSTCFSRKRVFGYNFVALASIAIAVLGFLVWAHHMFVAGISLYAALVFSLLSFFVAIPSAIKVFNWSATMYKGSIRFDTPMLYALGFIGLFTIGGLTGLFLACLGVDVHVHDTYFIIAHFHYIMVGGMVMAYMGGLHFWWPKISGKLYPEGVAKLSAMFVFFGFNLTFFPQFVLGYMGMPRRYQSYPPEFQVLNVLSTAGASILAVGYVLPMIYFLWSLRYGQNAPPNPWNAAGLEWMTASPPPTYNFDVTPVVTWEAYNYDELDKPKEVPIAR